MLKCKKHLPRKGADVNILRCILLNINEHIDTSYEDYKIDSKRFEALMQALIKNGIVYCLDETNASSTIGYSIFDIEKYLSWSKSNFYTAIQKYVLPLLPLI